MVVNKSQAVQSSAAQVPVLREHIAVAGASKREVLRLLLDRREMGEREGGEGLLLPARFHLSQFPEPLKIALHVGN